MRGKNIDMLAGSVTKSLLSLTAPIMIMNVMQTMFSVIDMTVLGNLVNDSAVGAVGACSTLITLCTGLFIGSSVGANVTVARHIGEGDRQRTKQAIGTSLAFPLVGGLLLLIIGVSCAEIFLRLTNCPESMVQDAVTYFRIYFLGAPIALLYNFSAAILRAAGDTKRPMYFLLFGGVLKVILNIFCITVLKLTVAGVAIATIASNATAGALCIYTIFTNKDKLSVKLRDIKIHFSELRKILFIGIPTGLQQALYSLANVIITTTVNGFGPDATTGVAIANQFDGILYQIAVAPSLAVTPYVSQNIGAGNMKRVKEAIRKGIMITVMFGATFGSLSAIFSGQLSSIMSSSPAVIRYSQQKMMLISSTYFICGINELMGGTLKGMGKPIIPTVATMIFMCVIRFPWVYVVFPLFPNLTFLYLIWPIGWILSICTLLIAYLRSMKKINYRVNNRM